MERLCYLNSIAMNRVLVGGGLPRGRDQSVPTDIRTNVSKSIIRPMQVLDV